MQWLAGRQLSKITTPNNTITFRYNADGLRTFKEDEEDYTTSYYYDSNNNMIGMKKNGSRMFFQYDSNVVSMTFNGTRYFYVKNQQGDVEKIVDKSGNAVVTYKYDAWGNPCEMTDDTSYRYGIGKMNPFRYRSYIYDDAKRLTRKFYEKYPSKIINSIKKEVTSLITSYRFTKTKKYHTDGYKKWILTANKVAVTIS